jgi:hypothetical protein
MEPRKITADSLRRLLSDLKAGRESAVGAWLYRGYRLQVSRYRATGAERSARLYIRRRREGLCVRCGAKVARRNPSTGSLYRMCDTHRKRIDQK